MPVHVSWDNADQTIVHYQMDRNWTWEEFFGAKARAQALINTVSHKVAVILETHHDGPLPTDLLGNIRNGLRTKHPRTALIIVVTTRPFIRTMIGTVRGLSPLSRARIELASDMDEARAIALHGLRSLQLDAIEQSDFGTR